MRDGGALLLQQLRAVLYGDEVVAAGGAVHGTSNALRKNTRAGVLECSANQMDSTSSAHFVHAASRPKGSECNCFVCVFVTIVACGSSVSVRRLVRHSGGCYLSAEQIEGPKLRQ